MIPWEFFDTEINIRGSVTVFCGDLVTANSTYVDIEKAGYQNSDATVPPTPDVHQQMIDILNAAKKIAQGVRDDADAGKFHGENGENCISDCDQTWISWNRARVDRISGIRSFRRVYKTCRRGKEYSI